MTEARQNDNVYLFPAPEEVEVVEGGRVKADTDDGYTRIANALLEAKYKAKLPGRMGDVFLVIVRKTYGFNKKLDWITSTQIAEEMELDDDSNVRSDLRELKKLNMIIRDGKKMGPNPVVSDWLPNARKLKATLKRVENNTCRKQPAKGLKTTRGRVENDPLRGLKTTHTKDKKDNITKDNIKEREKYDDAQENKNSEKNEIGRRVIEYLNLRAGRNYKVVESTLKMIRARLDEGHTEQDFKLVVDDKNAAWKDDPKMSQYIRPSTLFNAEKFNNYIGNIGSAPVQSAESELEAVMNRIRGGKPAGDCIEGELE